MTAIEHTTLQSAQLISRDQLEFPQRDLQVLRDLAARVAALAGRASEQPKRDLWRRHNQLEPTRPLIFCDPDNRWRYVKTIPNLRRVSVSPWANRAFMARQLEDRYIFSMKPNPADLAMDGMDEDHIRTSLRRDLEVSRGCHVEIVLKDTHTIRNDPQRVIRYVQIAREEIERL
jgi:hypothetical protein